MKLIHSKCTSAKSDFYHVFTVKIQGQTTYDRNSNTLFIMMKIVEFIKQLVVSKAKRKI